MSIDASHSSPLDSADPLHLARFTLTSVVGEICRQKVALDTFLSDHINQNHDLPPDVRATIRFAATPNDDEDRLVQNELGWLWESVSQVKKVGWDKRSGELVVCFYSGDIRRSIIEQFSSHFLEGHQKGLNDLSFRGAQHLGTILESSGPWNRGGEVLHFFEEGDGLVFLTRSSGTIRFLFPITPLEFIEKWRDTLSSMSPQSQARVIENVLSTDEWRENLASIESIKETGHEGIIWIESSNPEIGTRVLFLGWELEVFKSRWHGFIQSLPPFLKENFLTYIESHDGPWHYRGMITHARVLDSLAIRFELAHGGSADTYLPMLPSDFYNLHLRESYLPDEGKKLLFKAASSDPAPSWCRYGIVKRIIELPSGAFVLQTEEGNQAVCKTQSLEDFLAEHVKDNPLLSRRARDFITDYVMKNPYLGWKLKGLIHSITEDSDTGMITFHSISPNSPQVQMPPATE